MQTKFIFIITLIFFQCANAQSPKTKKLKLKKHKIALLSETIQETSTLCFTENKLYTLNDSGNPATLYEIDPENGTISQEIPHPDWKNFDWEALTFDGKHWYIGDIGNNWGTRQDLKIYKTNPENLTDTSVITYYFPEQKEFVKKDRKNNWDAESLEYIDGKLHLFTKEWESLNTNHYTISPDPKAEKTPAQKIEKFPLGYLATDVSYYQGKLYIVGYTKKMKVFLTVFTQSADGKFFHEKPKKYKLGNAGKVGQIEGIAVNEKGIYISGEKLQFKFLNAPQSLYFVPHQEL